MIVITVISILVGFAITQYSGLTPEARMVKARQDMNSLSLSLDNYAIRHGGRYPTSLSQLQTEMALEVPDTPWGHKYWIDRYYVYCFVPLKDYSSGMSTPQRLQPGEIEAPPTTENTIRQLYRNPGSLVLQAGQNVIVQQAIRGSASSKDTGMSANFGKGNIPRWFKRGYSVVYQTNTTDGAGIVIETLGGERRILKSASWDTGQELNLTGDYPSPSPDGDSLVLVESHQGKASLHVYSLIEGRTSLLGAEGNPIQGTAPVWSPHTDLIAFIDASGHLAVTNSRAKHPVTDVRVLVDDRICTSPAWHPAGQMVGFVSGGNIYKVPVGGQESAVEVFSNSQLLVKSFAWSPDGNLIAMVTGKDVYIWSIDWNQSLINTRFLASIMVFSLSSGTVNSISW